MTVINIPGECFVSYLSLAIPIMAVTLRKENKKEKLRDRKIPARTTSNICKLDHGDEHLTKLCTVLQKRVHTHNMHIYLLTTPPWQWERIASIYYCTIILQHCIYMVYYFLFSFSTDTRIPTYPHSQPRSLMYTYIHTSYVRVRTSFVLRKQIQA